MRFRITVETVIDIEADNQDEALEQFYDSIYEVDRHGNYRIEAL